METPLLLLPGLMCDAAVWRDTVAALGGGRVSIADYGDAASLAVMAERVLATAPARFAIAGHSMGGRVAFEILRRAPLRVAGVALLDTNYLPRGAGEAGAREERERMALLALARAEGTRRMGERWVQGMVHPDRLGDAALIEAILAMFARKSADIFAAQIRALLDRPDAGPILARIACPALVLCGREDGWSPPVRHEEMAAAIPGAALVIVERCGHMAPMERPEAVALALRDWLDAVAHAEAKAPLASA
ncbi:MAG: alpha/beta fold hydrolase [Rhodospirillaceae bacterium]|nr:alpha/beta fold hydrolase [Rhodospirillaceae bacterium]